MTQLSVALAAPLDVGASLEPFARWGDDLIDRWDRHTLRRVLRVAGTQVAIAATTIGTLDAPVLDVQTDLPESVAPEQVADAVRATFVTAPGELASLAARDPVIARLDALFPGVRPVLQPDPFTALIRAISAQQVNLGWAAEIRRRLAMRYGVSLSAGGEQVYRLLPERLAQATLDDLRRLQLTRARSEAVVACARAAEAGELSRDTLAGLGDDAVIERLVRLRGIGRWSAEWLLARTLGRPRVVAGDLGVRKAVGAAYLGGRMPSEAEVREVTSGWAGAAGVAQQLLLHALSEGVLAVTPSRPPPTRGARSSPGGARVARPRRCPP